MILSKEERADRDEMLRWIGTQQPVMQARVERWCAINSGSYHAAGVARMRETLKEEFAVLEGGVDCPPCLPMEVVTEEGEVIRREMEAALRIRKHSQADKRVLLMGHMDTVFPADHPFQQGRYLNENTYNAPGAADLKGGLAVMLTALMALERSRMAGRIGWQVLFNPDEEIGSHGSRHLMEEVAAHHDFAMVYEPALPDGSLAGARKGSGNFTVVVRGRAAHAGREPWNGRNAVVALSRWMDGIFALNRADRSVTVNPAQLHSSGPLNMVPPLAVGRFNIRVADAQRQQETEAALEELRRRIEAETETEITLHGGFTRPPKPMNAANRSVFEAVRETGTQLGLTLDWQETGGCCDGNNLSAYGLPNVDTLGVRGGNIHSAEEFMLVDSLAERAKLSFLLLWRYAAGEWAVG